MENDSEAGNAVSPGRVNPEDGSGDSSSELDHQIPVDKLIILYAIHEQETIKSSDLFDFILFRGYMDYFPMQSYVSEMVQTGLIAQMQDGDAVYYTLLPEGDSVVEMFRSRIPHSIRDDIRNYAKNSFLNNGSPLLYAEADILSSPDGSYEVQCHIRDYDRCVLTFLKTVSGKEEAERVRNEWLKKGMSVYWNITKELRHD